MSVNVRDLPGIKLRDFKPCPLCGKGVMHNRDLTFYRLSIAHLCVDPGAVTRQRGLEMQIGPLASVMGPDEDIAKIVAEHRDVLVCQPCAFEHMPGVLGLMEALVDSGDDK